MAKKKAKKAATAGDTKNTSQAAGGQAANAADKTQKQEAAGKGQLNAKAATEKKGSEKAPQKTAPKAGQDKKQEKAGLGDKLGQFKEFFEESKVELKKVTWPSRKETISTCIAVVVLTIVMSIYLGVVDWGLSKIVSFILS